MFRLEQDPQLAPPRPASTSTSSGRPVDGHRIVLALKGSKWIIAGTTALCAVCGFAAAKLAVPVEYESQATLVWEPGEGEQIDRPRALKTLIESVEIPSVLQATRNKLDVPIGLDTLAESIEVTNTSQSSVIILSASGPSPERAQAVANAAVDSLLEQRTAVARERAEEELARVGADLPRALDAADDARKALVEFRREHGLLDVLAQTEAGIAQASRLREAADTARAEAEGERARADYLKVAKKNAQEKTVMSERVVLPESVKLAETRAERSSLEAELAPEHPKVAALRAAEMSLGAVTIGPNAGATAERTLGRNPLWDSMSDALLKSEAEQTAQRTREDAFRKLADKTTEELLKLAELDGRAATLATRVAIAEKHVKDVEAARAPLVDAVEASGPGLRVLVRPDVPVRPLQSFKRAVAVVVPVFGAVLSLLVVLVRALWGLKAKTPSEIAYWARLPVVASSGWPTQREHLVELVSDIGAVWRRANGSTLVTPMGDAETATSKRLANALGAVLVSESKVANADEVFAGSHGMMSGHPAARREIRMAARTLLIVRAGAHSIFELLRLRTIASDGARVALVVIDTPIEAARDLDPIGDTKGFWDVRSLSRRPFIPAARAGEVE